MKYSLLVRSTFVTLLLALSLPASAENAKPYKIAVTLPENYVTECGSCHTPYPPYGLNATDWRSMMGKLDKHFGDNASLDAAALKPIEDFLIKNAGDVPSKVSPGDTASSAVGTARMTQTAWFTRKHREVPNAYWKDARIKSAANCTACHPRANEARYNEHEIKLPAGMKWEHD
jgi:hypothetical protein